MNSEQINVACAEAVGRCACKTYDKPGDWETAVCHGCGKNPFFAEHSNPSFTASLDAAITLCDWMAERGWVWRLDNAGYAKNCSFIGGGDIVDRDERSASAPTLSAAICTAFLKANGLYHE